MKKFVKGKFTAVLLAVALTLAVSSAALALNFWPSFQEDYTNNGVITSGSPIGATTTATAIPLRTNGTTYAGVDTTSVISGDYSYTLYDGGTVSGDEGGARLAVISVSGKSWVGDYQIDNLADNAQQLSTPYINNTNGKLYAATTYYIDLLAGTGPSDWINIATGQPLTSFTFPVGSTGIKYVGLSVPSDYWEPQLATDINIGVTGLSGDVSLTQNGIDFGEQSYYPGDGNWTLYNESGVMLNDGTYDLTFTVNNQTGDVVSAGSIKFLVSGWNLWGINVTGATPSKALLASGYGQANTPIKYDSGQGSFYFGIYEGDRSYYKYEIGNNGTLTPFDAQDDFYWAGAIVVSGNVIFGSDSGKLYMRNATNFGASGSVINLAAYLPGTDNPGKVRSTIVDGNRGYLYFTSSGTGPRAYLWAVLLSASAPSVTYARIPPITAGNTVSSASTPVVSPNDFLYVGTSEYTSQYLEKGGVLTFDVLAGPLSPTMPYTVIYADDPVMASPIVRTDETVFPPIDYIYFTTNIDAEPPATTPVGAGYGYKFDGGFNPPSRLWKCDNTSGNKYSLQGMAASGGKVIWGDDGNYLYVAP
jgi:hypothetical protein